MVSLAHPRARSTPATAAHAPPPANPSSAMAGSSSAAGQCPRCSAPHVAHRAPMKSCPSPPTLISQIRDGTATASAVRMSGATFTSVSEKPYALPSVLAKMSTYARNGFLPKTNSSTAKAASAKARRPAARASRSATRGRPARARHQVADLVDAQLARPALPHHATAEEHEQPVTEREQLVQILRDEQHTGARLARGEQRLPRGDRRA